MKSLLASVLLLISGSALGLDECLSGSWYEPATSGQGVNLEVHPEAVVAYFYTYHTGKEFYVLVGENVEDADGVLQLRAFETVGESSFPKAELEVGYASFELLEDGTLLFQYDFQLDADRLPYAAIPWCIGCNGTLVLEQLTGYCE